MQNIKLDALKSQFKVDIYHTAGFSKATKLLIKYSLDITLGQSNLLLLNPYGYGSESWFFFSFFFFSVFLVRCYFFSLENEVMHVDWRKRAKESDPPHHNIIMRNVEDFTHSPSKVVAKTTSSKIHLHYDDDDDINRITINVTRYDE